MNNHWLNSQKKKKMFEELQDAFYEAADNDATFGELLETLTDEQASSLMDMRFTDFQSDPIVFSFNLEIIVP